MDPLKDLKGIHLPDPISFWPPALIWYFIAALVICAIAGMMFLIWKILKNKRLRKRALKELEKIKKQKNPTRQIINLSELLRRVAVKVYSRKKVASVSGKAWLQLLNQGIQSNEFTDGVGAVISTIPYQKIPSQNLTRAEIKALICLVNKWLLGVTKRGHHV